VYPIADYARDSRIGLRAVELNRAQLWCDNMSIALIPAKVLAADNSR
jgi:hypothetical protein